MKVPIASLPIGLLLSQLLSIGPRVAAQIATSQQNDILYSFSAPLSTKSAGDRDAFMQIKAPARYTWIGLGSGARMDGSYMLIVYADASGNGLTLSPRNGSGHSTPTFDRTAKVSLMDGSGIKDGVMTANINCTGCSYKYDLTSEGAVYVYAAKEGDLLRDDDSVSASLVQHDNTYGTMFVNMTEAKNVEQTNPFVTSTSSSASATSSGTAASTSQSQPIGDPSSSSDRANQGTKLSGGALAGAIVGAVASLALLIAAAVVSVKWYRRRKTMPKSVDEPFVWDKRRTWVKPELDGDFTERGRTAGRSEVPGEDVRYELDGSGTISELDHTSATARAPR